jgi:hypothetical protein
MSVAFIYFVPQYRLKYGLQSDKVKGEISITCNAWQANNVDGYFVVTGHWIEESSAGCRPFKKPSWNLRGSTMFTMGSV